MATYVKTRLQHLKTRLHGGVAEGYVLADRVLRGAHKVYGEELDELVLHVLDEVQPRSAIGLHEVHCKMIVRLLDAVVEHTNQHVGVISEVHHEFLLLLHGVEALQVAGVCVQEEQVALSGKLEANHVDVGITSLEMER